jgi:hypothetical protein
MFAIKLLKINKTTPVIVMVRKRRFFSCRLQPTDYRQFLHPRSSAFIGVPNQTAEPPIPVTGLLKLKSDYFQ